VLHVVSRVAMLMNVGGHVRHCSDKQIVCLQLYAHSAVGSVTTKDLNILQILSDLPLYFTCSVPVICIFV
jgi:hypothetical protein